MRVKEALAEAAAEQAVSYLKDRGFRVLDRDWRHDGHIVPIVAADGRALVAVDLRVRAETRHGAPLGAVSTARAKTLHKLAARWLAAHGMRFDQIRIDVVGLLQESSGGFTVEHVKAAG